MPEGEVSSNHLGGRVVISGLQTLYGTTYPLRRYKQWGLFLGEFLLCMPVGAHCALDIHPPCDMDIQPVAGVNPTIQSVGL